MLHYVELFIQVTYLHILNRGVVMKFSKLKIMSVLTTLSILSVLISSAFITSEVADSVAVNASLQDRTCVIIDAGHGGVDGGAISCTGVEESKINLEIALRLDDLMHLLGIQTKMIRTEDVSIYTKGDTIAAKKVSDLKERVRIVSETKNALLVSIHQNYFEDSRYSGAQVFYNNDTALAKELQSAFVTILNPGSKRKIKKSNGVYLMDKIACNGLLIECGFLSNKNEEALLRDATYQKKICCVIGATISCHISDNTAT